MADGLRKRMIVNTISNYASLLIRLGLSLILTRVLFLGLSREHYGMWALLWSVFGYSLLLDFGFGTSLQKYTSEVLVNKDWERYNRLVSTVFFSYCLMSLLIAGFTLALTPFLKTIFRFQTISDYKEVFLMFGLGTAILFPFGFFSEILRGMQEIKLRNLVQISFFVINFILMVTVIKLGLSLKAMTVVTLGVNLLTSLTMGFLCFRKLPQLRIRPTLYDLRLLKSVMGFSIYAYIIMFSNLIIFKTDQLVISIFSSIALVAVYQVASRIAEIFRQFSTQFLDNLGPVAATLFTAKEDNKLKQILIQSNRLVGFIATLLFIPLFIYIRPLLAVWLKLEDSDGIASARLLLISMYILVVFRSSTVQILLMAGKERILTIVALIECTANLILSIILIRFLGIRGVALGTLIPNLFLAIAFNIPAACKFASINIFAYLKEAVIKTVITAIPITAAAYAIYRLSYPGTLPMLLLYTGGIVLLYIMIYLFTGLHRWEREQLWRVLEKKKS